MQEIIVLTREQYQQDLHTVAMQAATEALNLFTSKRKNPATLTRAQFAREVSKSKATVKLMIDQGRIKTTSDGSCIPYTEVQRFLNK